MRTRPQLTPAQLKSIAAHSRGQIQSEARQRELEASLASLEHALARPDARLERLKKINAWWTRHGHWFARAALIPIAILAVGLVSLVAVGLWSGEINAISRSSSAMVSRIDRPVAYWLTVVHHSLLAGFITYVATVVLQLSRSQIEPEIVSSDAVELFEVTAHASGRQPLEGSAVMEFHSVDPAAQPGRVDHAAATASTSSSQTSS